MTEKTTTSTEKPAAAAKPKKILPLVAIHAITYGDNKDAPPRSFFTPVSEEERAALLLPEDNPPARELDKTEKVLFKNGGDSADDDDDSFA